MTYLASEVSRKLGLSKDTLRYYEKEGLLPLIGRDNSGHRNYTDADIEWIFLIRCLRDTNMPIFKIKQYVSLLKNGEGNSIPERRNILAEHKYYITEKIALFQNLLKLIDKKIDFYDEALQAPETVKCVDYADEWEHFRSLIGGINHE
jgi:Predicted transcriptional regulators